MFLHIIEQYTTWKRTNWLKKQRRRLKNKDFTLITNNCIGGVIYSDLGLQFLSPTINLFFSIGDYLEFIKNMVFYVQCTLVEKADSDKEYPVGVLMSNDAAHRDLEVHFQHYHSFQEAKDKWIVRCARINWNNCIALMEFYDNVNSKELLYEFDRLQMKKAVLVHRDFPDIQSAFTLTCYVDNKPIAKSLQINKITGKRYLDEFDYVGFLNKREEEV